MKRRSGMFLQWILLAIMRIIKASLLRTLMMFLFFNNINTGLWITTESSSLNHINTRMTIIRLSADQTQVNHSKYQDKLYHHVLLILLRLLTTTTTCIQQTQARSNRSWHKRNPREKKKLGKIIQICKLILFTSNIVIQANCSSFRWISRPAKVSSQRIILRIKHM